MKPFNWKDQGSDPGDDQVCEWNGYLLHAEQLDDEEFYCAVDIPLNDKPPYKYDEIFHNTWGEEPNRIFPLSWQSARHLCEMAALEHWIKSQTETEVK